MNNVNRISPTGLDPECGTSEIFICCVFVYLVTVAGNLLIMITVNTSKSLGSPMYFFLSYLSLINVCYSSSMTSNMLANSLAVRKTISFRGCMTQIFSEHLFGAAEIILLTVMAYDPYGATCKPLHYTTIMSLKVCGLLVGVVWAGGFDHAIILILFTVWLPFCGLNIIDYFMCGLNPLLKLVCMDTHILGLYIAANSGFICLFNLLFLMVSYVVILYTLKSHSLKGRSKALSTCISHITVVILFFMSCIFVNLHSQPPSPLIKLWLFYAIITPMLNSLIYTLRNAEVKNATRKLWGKMGTSTVK